MVRGNFPMRRWSKNLTYPLLPSPAKDLDKLLLCRKYFLIDSGGKITPNLQFGHQVQQSTIQQCHRRLSPRKLRNIFSLFKPLSFLIIFKPTLSDMTNSSDCHLFLLSSKKWLTLRKHSIPNTVFCFLSRWTPK